MFIVSRVARGLAYAHTKTDKDGKYAQVLPRGGVYAITVEPEKLNYSEKHAITDGQENTIVINFKEIIAQQAASPEEAKKAEEAANNFKNMKGHFDAGVAAMTDSSQVRQQLATAPADQKSALQDKIKADSATAVTEFQGAEQAAGTKDVKNHALIWANLGQAYDLGGRYDDAAGAYQKAIELQPAAPYYTHLSTSLANAAVSQTDPKVTQQKVSDAEANCDKASTLEGATPGSAAVCWKNLGIILNNKGDLKDAILPFQKATTANPKDDGGTSLTSCQEAEPSVERKTPLWCWAQRVSGSAGQRTTRCGSWMSGSSRRSGGM